ncbi:MAG: hypothetical protein KDA90_08115 [Planctomycetaceae bacterium]|nr:hypothetical protein [Planctomycetaceae bacterium]
MTSPESASKQSAAQPKDEPAWLVQAEWSFIAWMLYIFSIGPMYWQWYIAKFSFGGSYWIALFYEPLWRLAEWIPPFGAVVDFYVSWWILG